MIALDLLDANFLITASKTYYPIDQVPEFWSWLQYQGESGSVKMPLETIEEVKAGRKDGDLLIKWISLPEIEEALLLQESVDIHLVQEVVSIGYASDLNDTEIDAIGRDPFLVAYALSKPDERCVVTLETSKPNAQRQNREIPDVCNALGVPWCGPFALNRRRGFTTNWRAKT